MLIRFHAFFVLICASLVCISSYAQKPEILTVEGESQVEFPDTKSRAEVEREALEQASINALEKAFGTMVIRGNSTYMKNVNSGKETKTSVVFNTIANTEVKGEVLGTKDKKFEVVEAETTLGGKKLMIRALKCTARFTVRELSDDVPEFESSPLNCPLPACKTKDFVEKDSMYMFFKSPYSGYLAIYLDNGRTSQCLLPYARMPESFGNGVPVVSGKDYVFFNRSPSADYFENLYYVDEYELSADSELEQDRMFIVFSRSPIESPELQTGLDEKLLTASDRAKRYKLPKSLPSEDFQKWLIKARSRKTDMKVVEYDITIKK